MNEVKKKVSNCFVSASMDTCEKTHSSLSINYPLYDAIFDMRNRELDHCYRDRNVWKENDQLLSNLRVITICPIRLLIEQYKNAL